MFFSQDTVKIDRAKLPPTIADILYNFLVPIHNDTEISCLLNILLAKIAHAVSFKRVKFKINPEQNPIIANYYALNFVPSGGGKDWPIDNINNYLLKGFEEKFNASLQERREQMELEYKDEAQELFYGKDAKIDEYVRKKTENIRDCSFETGGGTSQALAVDAIQLHKNGFGSMFLRESEFGLSLQSGKEQKKEYLQKVIECYDGHFPVQSLKSENKKYFVKDIPVNVVFYTSIAPLMDEKKVGAYLDTLFRTGLLRRCYVSFQKNALLKTDYDVKDRAKEIKTAFATGKSYEQVVISKIDTISENAVFRCTEEVFYYYLEYEKQNKIKHNRILEEVPDEKKEQILAEIRGKAYKTSKLACIIAAFEHPEFQEITLEDLDYAIYLSEIFTIDLDYFLKERPKTEVEIAYDFIKTHKDGVSTMELRDSFVPKYTRGREFSRWFEALKPFIEEFAEKKGTALVSFKSGSKNNRETYKITEDKHGKPLSPGVVNLDEVV